MNKIRNFLGNLDSANAINIQVWACLIAQLIMKVIQKMAEKQWGFKYGEPNKVSYV